MATVLQANIAVVTSPWVFLGIGSLVASFAILYAGFRRSGLVRTG
jgi:hypothetical protein